MGLRQSDEGPTLSGAALTLRIISRCLFLERTNGVTYARLLAYLNRRKSRVPLSGAQRRRSSTMRDAAACSRFSRVGRSGIIHVNAANQRHFTLQGQS